MFQNGTHVYLNPETTITFPKKFGFSKRKITLNGKVYFDVAKNANRPFVVNLGNTSINVLGTSSKVKSYTYEPDIEVILDNGLEVLLL